MNKIAAVVFGLVVSSSAMAVDCRNGVDHRPGFCGGHIGGYEQVRHYGYGGHGGGWNWVAPAIIGGIVGYELGRPQVIQQPPVIVQPAPVYSYPQPQPMPYGYRYIQAYDPSCGCYKQVMVPN